MSKTIWARWGSYPTYSCLTVNIESCRETLQFNFTGEKKFFNFVRRKKSGNFDLVTNINKEKIWIVHSTLTRNELFHLTKSISGFFDQSTKKPCDMQKFIPLIYWNDINFTWQSCLLDLFNLLKKFWMNSLRKKRFLCHLLVFFLQRQHFINANLIRYHTTFFLNNKTFFQN